MKNPIRKYRGLRAFLDFVGSRRAARAFALQPPDVQRFSLVLSHARGGLGRVAVADQDGDISAEGAREPGLADSRFPGSLFALHPEIRGAEGIPSTFKKGGLASSLKQNQQEGEWRDRVCDSIASTLHFSEPNGNGFVTSFRTDLENIRHRTKYLTALAGAVFFLVMQGIDSIGDNSESIWLKNPMMGWVAATNDISQLMALALFLVLLYISGNQSYHSLLKYLNSAELAQLRRKQEGQSGS